MFKQKSSLSRYPLKHRLQGGHQSPVLVCIQFCQSVYVCHSVANFDYSFPVYKIVLEGFTGTLSEMRQPQLQSQDGTWLALQLTQQSLEGDVGHQLEKGAGLALRPGSQPCRAQRISREIPRKESNGLLPPRAFHRKVLSLRSNPCLPNFNFRNFTLPSRSTASFTGFLQH